MRVVYIVGLGRSGSTLLDLLVDSHSNACSLGGVRRLINALENDCPCEVGSHKDCALWRDIEARVERDAGVGLSELKPNSSDPATFRRHNEALFRAAATAAGTDVVVDSSKSVSRLRRLLNETGLEVYPIHIVRDARGYVYSQYKRKGQRLIPAWSYLARTLRVYALLRSRPHTTVEYGHLVRETRQCLSTLMPRLGLAFEPEQLDWTEHSHHNVGGGAVLKKTRDSRIQIDESWRQRLGPVTQAIIQLIASPAMVANKDKERRWGLS